MTRTVDDLARVLACVAGPDGYDPRQAAVPATLPDYVGALGQSVAGLRIGVLAEGFGVAGGEADVDATVRQALSVLQAAGATLVDVSVPAHRVAPFALLPIFIEGGRQLYDTNCYGAFGTGYYPASFVAAFGRAKRSHSHELPLNFKLMLLAGTYAHDRYNGRLYAKAKNMRPAIVEHYRAAFRGVDVLAMPTVAVKAHRYATPADYAEAIDRTLFGGQLGQDLGVLIANTAPFNYTGFPAVSVPCGKSDGLPVGLQLVAPYFREDLLIKAAHAYQRGVDWESFYP
jgi:amidase